MKRDGCVFQLILSAKKRARQNRTLLAFILFIHNTAEQAALRLLTYLLSLSLRAKADFLRAAVFLWIIPFAAA